MNLKEMNKSYDEYALTEEYYLEEGLKSFKKSKRLYKYADRIDKKIVKAETKKIVSPSEVSKLKSLSKDIMKLADEFKVIEDNFSSGEVDKKVSKQKLKRIKATNDRLITLMKKEETKNVFKKIGIGALSAGILAALWGVAPMTGIGILRSAGAVSSKQGII